MRSGCSTGRPAASARALTGASDTFCPRPRGRSGCVTTPTTVCGEAASSASSVGTANSGVPKKTMRRGGTVATGGRMSVCVEGHHLPARVSFWIFRTIRSRLMPRRRSTKSAPSRWSISC